MESLPWLSFETTMYMLKAPSVVKTLVLIEPPLPSASEPAVKVLALRRISNSVDCVQFKSHGIGCCKRIVCSPYVEKWGEEKCWLTH